MSETGTWGGYTDGAYLVREALARALAEAAHRVLPSGARRPAQDVVLLDIGGRGRPYAALFSSSPRASGYNVRHVIVDPDPDADVRGLAEALPFANGIADVVLCTQALEHVGDPGRAVSEMARVLGPRGACVLTTHGTWFYHPDPEDYWRWTPAGLRRLFAEQGFGEVHVEPIGGTKLALVSLALAALERAAGDGWAGRLSRRLLVAPANLVAAAWLLGGVTKRASVPGELVIDYLVVARRSAGP